MKTLDDKQMLIFDFDGVVIDSMNEVTVTAYNTASGNLALCLEDLPAGFVELFQRYRYHVQPASDMVVLADWCIANCAKTTPPSLDANEYQKLLQNEQRPARARQELFFQTRRLFVEKDEDRWLALNHPYYPLWSFLLEHGTHRLILLTNKNSAAVKQICSHHGLDLPDENVYGAEHGHSKDDNLEKLHQRFGAQSYLFIDDSIGNLLELANKFDADFLKPLLGSWGYLGPDDFAIASSQGFPIFSQEQLIGLATELWQVATNNY